MAGLEARLAFWYSWKEASPQHLTSYCFKIKRHINKSSTKRKNPVNSADKLRTMSKNKLSRITLGVRPEWEIHSLTIAWSNTVHYVHVLMRVRRRSVQCHGVSCSSVPCTSVSCAPPRTLFLFKTCSLNNVFFLSFFLPCRKITKRHLKKYPQTRTRARRQNWGA